MSPSGQGIELKSCQCGMLSESYFCDIRPRVALVSLPGSGNTWVRVLLEHATGYCTGSMWCDPYLRAKQFCAEGIRECTLVVKNHDPTVRWLGEPLPRNSITEVSSFNKPEFGSAIFIHRNLYEAIVAEWNRAVGFRVHDAKKQNQIVADVGYYNLTMYKPNDPHMLFFGREAFGTNPGWNKTIYTQMENWKAMINYLLINNTVNRPVLLVKYEDLKRDAYQEVERIVNFLNMTVKNKHKLQTSLQNGLHTFHRKHTQMFEHYTQEL